MKKKGLTHTQIEDVINTYLHALATTEGQRVADATEVYYKKRHFYIRPPGVSKHFFPIPNKPEEMQAMTVKLGGHSQVPAAGQDRCSENA
jgi:hypothetical protein